MAIKAVFSALGAGFANAVLQFVLWFCSFPLLYRRPPVFFQGESGWYSWLGILLFAPVLWGVATVLWVLLFRYIDVEDWKVLVAIPMLGASCGTLLFLTLAIGR